MGSVTAYRDMVMGGGRLNREQAIRLAGAPLDELTAAADEIRAHFCGNGFDLCTIVNGKCGRCTEDCKYCAQSAHYHTSCTESYPLLPADKLVRQAKACEQSGVLRYSIVTSGRRLSEREVDAACEGIREIRRQTGLRVCVSFGLIDEGQFRRLRQAGASRVHCNLETSERYFPQVCTTHTFADKAETLRAAQRAGLSVCAGGIIGLGETMEDRIDMALAARALGVRSVPVNLLNPIAGTPYESRPVPHPDELRRTVAVFRFLLPDASIRLAGGRGLTGDKGEACFRGGANAAITGDMLTTAGITVQTDRALLGKMGYEVRADDA